MKTLNKVGLYCIAFGCFITIIFIPFGAIILGQIGIIEELEKLNGGK